MVGTGATFLHLNSNVFHEPQLFSPERWLQPNSKGLHKHLVPFSKGPRMCLGIKYVWNSLRLVSFSSNAYSLAWCELYLIFGNIFRRLDLEIYNTTWAHLEPSHHLCPDSLWFTVPTTLAGSRNFSYRSIKDDNFMPLQKESPSDPS